MKKQKNNLTLQFKIDKIIGLGVVVGINNYNFIVFSQRKVYRLELVVLCFYFELKYTKRYEEKKKKTTDVDLVEVLKKRSKELNTDYDHLICRCKRGDYHNFRSSYSLPKIELIKALNKHAELSDIVQDVKNGMYDE